MAEPTLRFNQTLLDLLQASIKIPGKTAEVEVNIW